MKHIFSPLRIRSLTSSIDTKIHRAVRGIAPYKYWLFRMSALVERAGVVMALIVFSAYYVGNVAIRLSGKVKSWELLPMSEEVAVALLVCVAISVVGEVVNRFLFEELEPIALRAAQTLFK